MLQERISVAVNFLDAHRGQNLSQLPEDDFFRLLSNLAGGQTQQTDGPLLHHGRFSANRDREHTRHVDTNVFSGECTAQRNLNLNRVEIEECVVLNQRPHEGGTTVNRFGRVALATCLTVDNQHAVTRTSFVLTRQ